jgi:hypothetical protein
MLCETEYFKHKSRAEISTTHSGVGAMEAEQKGWKESSETMYLISSGVLSLGFVWG